MTINQVEKSESVDDVRHIDITVKAETLQDDLFSIYSLLFENISREEVVFEELHGGYVNSIIKLSLKKDKEKSLIFRTFGMKFNMTEFNKNCDQLEKQEDNSNAEVNNNTIKTAENAEQPSAEPIDLSKMIFSRMTEYKVMNAVNQQGLCKKVYAKYNNGICYGYTYGVVLNGALMLTNDFLNEMAPKLAKFHSINYKVPGIPYETHYDRIKIQAGPAFETMLKQVDNELGEKLNEYPFNEIPRIENILEEETKILDALESVGFGRIAFCHNDCNQKNVIWNSHEKTLGFIDFEMSMNNYVCLELGYLFGCYPGHFLYDFDLELFPRIDYRRRFLRKYLEEFNKLNAIEQSDEKFEMELEDLLIRSDLGVLMFLIRLIMVGKFFDKRPEMFTNEDLKKKREETEYFCTKWSLKINALFDVLKDETLERAKKHLESKNSKNQAGN